MATVFRCHDPNLDRFVAIKVLPSLFSEDGSFSERFARETQTIARLNHPNILRVHDFGEDKGYSYIITELIYGDNLADRLTGALPIEEILGYTKPLAEALDYAHGSGVVHRDLKPANVLLTENGQPILADFGLALLNAIDHAPHPGQPGVGHARVHVSGTGDGKGRRPPLRPVFLRRSAIPDAIGAGPLQRGNSRGYPDRPCASAPATAQSNRPQPEPERGVAAAQGPVQGTQRQVPVGVRNHLRLTVRRWPRRLYNRGSARIQSSCSGGTTPHNWGSPPNPRRGRSRQRHRPGQLQSAIPAWDGVPRIDYWPRASRSISLRGRRCDRIRSWMVGMSYSTKWRVTEFSSESNTA